MALNGCQPIGGGSAISGAPTTQSGSIANARELLGEYRIASVDERDVDLPHGISASIGPDRIDVESGCIRFAWSYSLEAGALVTQSEPVASCRRGLLPEEQLIQRAFGTATSVVRTPANGVLFSGGGNSVTLFSQ